MAMVKAESTDWEVEGAFFRSSPVPMRRSRNLQKSRKIARGYGTVTTSAADTISDASDLSRDPSKDRELKSVESSSEVKGHFPATHWTQFKVINDPSHPDCHKALGELCTAYLPAIETYFRRFQLLRNDSEMHANDFLAGFIHHDSLKRVDRSKGKFRHYLSQAIRNYAFKLIDENRRKPMTVELEFELATPVSEDPNPSSFDYPFAKRFINRCLELTKDHFYGTKIEPYLPILLPHAVGEPSEGVLQELGVSMGVSRDLVYQNFRRIRMELRKQLLAEGRRIIGPDDSDDEEIRDLIRAFSQASEV